MFDFTVFTDDKKKLDFLFQVQIKLEDKRRPLDDLRQKCSEIFLPRRYDLLCNCRAERGKQFGARSFDPHPAIAANKHVLGILGYMVSRSVPWLASVASNQRLMNDDDIKQYCQESAEQVLYSFGAKSNFYGSSVWFAKDATVIATAVSLPEEDLVNGKMMYHNVHPAEVWCGDDQYGNLGVLHYKTKKSVIQLLLMFGRGKLSPEMIKEAAETNPFREYEVLMAYYKNINPVPDSLRSENKAWKIFYALCDKDSNKRKLLLESGTDFGPIVERPGKESGIAYGISLAADALTAGRVVNQITKKGLQAISKTLEPPMLAHSNLRGKLFLGADARTWTDDMNTVYAKPLLDRINWPMSDAEIQRFHAYIDDIFFIRFFEMLSAGDLPQITAYQASQMLGEKAVLMSAITGTFETEGLEPHVKVQWEFERKTGRMPDPPAVLFDENYEKRDNEIAYLIAEMLAMRGFRTIPEDEIRSIIGRKININFVGPLSQLQRSLLRSKGIIDSLAIGSEIIKIWPSAAVKIDEMQLIEEAMIAQGMQQKLIKSDEEVKAILDKVAQKEQLQEQLAVGELAAKAAPAMSQEIKPNSPLALLSQGV